MPKGYLPEELQRRQERLEKIAQLKSEIETRAQVRYDQEKAEYEAKLRERTTKEQARGRKLGGKQPQAPDGAPKAKDQVNFTDGESRIMPISGGGFEQANRCPRFCGYGQDADCRKPCESKS